MANECNVDGVVIMRRVSGPAYQGAGARHQAPSQWTWEHHTGPNPYAQTAARRRCGSLRHAGGTACLRGEVVDQCPSCNTSSSPGWEEERAKLLAPDSQPT